MDGHSYTSNTAKLLKHLPMLQGLQQGKRPQPVMVHIAPNNSCQLTCEYCCFAGRNLGQQLNLEQVSGAIEYFSANNTKAIEWTGGGEPTLWKHLNDAVWIANHLDLKQGLITNGIKFDWFDNFDLLEWMRVSLHGFNEGKRAVIEKNIKLARVKNPKLTISSVYIWTTGSDAIYPEVAAYAEANEIPTRVTPDLTAGPESIDAMMLHVGKAVADNPHNFTFLSDFNVKTERAHDRCYMHMVKPFIFPDGWVYVCPSIGLTPETDKNVLEEFRVCRIEDIREYYSQPQTMRHHACGFCKYAAQNEIVDNILLPTTHNEFA